MEDDLNIDRIKTLESQKAAQETEQRKNDLLIYLAHDLKTPLTSVLGYLNEITRFSNKSWFWSRQKRI